MTEPTTASVKSAERVLEILDLLTAEARPMSFTELLSALGYPRSSLHALMHTICATGWVEMSNDGHSYQLGIRAWEAGSTYMGATSLVERAKPCMVELRRRLDETVQLAILDGRSTVYLAKEEGRQVLTLASSVGRRLEAHATGLGKVLLADLDPDEVRDRYRNYPLQRFTDRTITDLNALQHELIRIKKRGFGADNEEYTPGVRCAAAPVMDSTGSVVAAMSVSVPTVRASVLREATPLLLEQTALLSAALGYRPLRIAPQRTLRPREAHAR